MLCPHCGHENVAGRKYCRACAQPLAPEIAPPQSVAPAPTFVTAAVTSSPRSTPDVNHMAIASLSLSVLAFFVPLGIASVVMGHMSRAQIARSNGRQIGTWLAFAGLVISYFQLTLVAIVCLNLASALHRMNRQVGQDDFLRAAMVAQLLHRTPNPTSNRKNAIDSLRLIHARQTDYLAAHPDEGYACQLHQLWDQTAPSELNLHITNSHYAIQIYQCRGFDQKQYAVIAIPQSDSNPLYSPVYCVDQTGVVRRADPDLLNDLTRILITERKSCPLSGDIVE